MKVGEDPYTARTFEGGEWKFTCCACPVQAEGTIDGLELYFRSRHDEWTFAIGADAVMIDRREDGFFRRAPVMDAGYLPLADAEAIIERCLGEYRLTR
jgi:hypothetical protein